MPAAALAPAPRRPLTLTERNWLTAFAIVVASALLFYALQALERRVGHADRDEAFVYNAMETPMRLVGLAHILIAIAFLTTSRAMKRASSWVWLGGLLAAGVGLCLAFEGAGGMDARLPKVLFFLYFLLHEFRDQAFFYEANGDLPRGGDALRLRRDLQGIPLLALGLIGAVFALLAGLEITGARRYAGALFGWAPAPWRPLLGAVPFLLWGWAAWSWRRRIERGREGGLSAFLRTHRPMLLVYGGILAVLLLDILVNRRAYAIVTLHVAAWYVFVRAGFARRPPPAPPPPPATWRWVRTTATGFNWLHIGLVGLVTVAAIAWAYGTRNDAGLTVANVVLSHDAFPYWTIMHVTLSWMPR